MQERSPGAMARQLGLSVNINMGMQGQPLSPADAYQLMCAKVIPADPNHPAFKRPAIEQQPVSSVDKAETPEK